ncbi:MAG TPA: hypothetical protein VK858_21715 [Longimicrobiales bacterium]|nr:hypothetical protein [Longimicrobiales bacterium]
MTELGGTLRRKWRELLLEGLAVLFGVLLALAADSWANGQDAARVEAAYLVALREELLANSELVAAQLERTRTRVEEGRTYLAEVVHTRPGDQIGTDEVNGMLLQVGPYRRMSYQRGALDDLLTAGGMELVRSEEIRREILRYARLLEQESVRQEAALDFWEDQMSPYYYEHASLAGFLPWAGELGTPPAEDLDVSAFAGSTRYSNLLIERIVRDQTLGDATEELGDNILELASRLEDVAR